MLAGGNARRAVFIALCGITLAACAGTGIGFPTAAPPFDQMAYQNAVSAKFETLALVDRAGDRYAVRKVDADTAAANIEKAYAYAAGQANNQLAIQAWERIRDPQGGSAGGFLRFWREKNTLPPTYRSEKRRQLTAHFDYVICIEANKQAATACPSPFGPGS
jgi:hypothetical protein